MATKPKDLTNKLWGWTIHGVSGQGKWTVTEEEYYTQCPFCSADDKFYINPVKSLFNCKVCDIGGTYLKFLEEVHKVNLTYIKEVHRNLLAEERQLPVEAFDGLSIGWNGTHFTIAVYDTEGEMIGLDLYKAGEKIMHSSKPAKVGLWNAPKLKEHMTGPIWIAEGLWDGLAMQWLLNELGEKGLVIAAPGCQTNIAPWTIFLQDKQVNVIYDHDAPGIRGEFKIYQTLDTACKELTFHHWPEEKPDGYDIRDHIIKFIKKGDPKKAYKLIEQRLQEIPRFLGNMARSPDGKTFLEHRKEKLEPISFQEMMKVCREYLYFKNDDPVRVMLGTIYANRFRGDMVWMFLVAPPSFGKSELLMSLDMCKAEVEHVTTVSENTLVSGYLGMGHDVDVSLLPKLRNRILAIKDFTPLLKMVGPVQQKIFGTFRDAYDGRIDAMYGHGKNRRFEGLHFGIIAGVTPEIEVLAKMQVSLGERFLRYNFPSTETDQININKQAEGNIGHEKKRKEAFAHAVYRFLETNKDFPIPKRSEAISNRIRALADFLVLMRSVVPRDFKERVQYTPMREGSARVNKQLNYLSMGLACLERKAEVGEHEMTILRRVIESSCPDIVQKAVFSLWNSTTPLTLKRLEDFTRFPIGTLKYVMDDLIMLGIAQNIGEKFNKAYLLTDKAKELIISSGIYGVTTPSSQEEHPARPKSLHKPKFFLLRS